MPERLKLVLISDTHTYHRKVELPDGDVLVHAGDFTAMGRTGETTKFLQWFGSQPHRHKVLVAGNHDFMCLDDPEQFARLLAEFAPGVQYLSDERNSVVIEGVRFTGTPSTPVFGHWAFMKTQGELQQVYARFPADTDVLVTHGPAWGVLDTCFPSGDRAGCPSLRNWIEVHKPQVHVHGHIHEGYGTHLGDTLSVNAAICNREYRPENRPFITHVIKRVTGETHAQLEPEQTHAAGNPGAD